MDDQKLTDVIFNLLKEDKIKESITVLKNHISSSDKLEMLVVQSARYTNVVRRIHLGTIEEVFSSIEQNKIRLALMELAREIEEQIDTYPVITKELEQSSTNSTSRLLLTIMPLVVMSLACIVIIFSFTSDKAKLAIENKNFTIEEVENHFKQLSDENKKIEKKDEIIGDLLKNFDIKTKVYVKGHNGTIVYEGELEQFLKELSFGVHDDLKIESKRQNSIALRYIK